MTNYLPFPSQIFGPDDAHLALKSGKDVHVAYRHALLATIVRMAHKLDPGEQVAERYTVDRANYAVYAKAFATLRIQFPDKHNYLVYGLKKWPKIGRVSMDVECPLPEIVHFLGYAIAEDKVTKWWALSEADYIYEFKTRIADAAIDATCEWIIFGDKCISNSRAADKEVKKKILEDLLRYMSMIVDDLCR